MNIKFFIPLLGFALGIYFSEITHLDKWIPTIAIGLSLIFWIIITVWNKDPLKGRKAVKLHFLWILFLFVGLGSLDYFFNGISFVEKNLSKKSFIFTGEVTEVRNLANDDRLVIKVSSIKDTLNNDIYFRNLNLLLKSDAYDGSKGVILSFKASPEKFNLDSKYGSIMYHKGIEYFVNVKNENIIKRGKSNSLSVKIDEWKKDLIIELEKCSLHRETSEFLISILLGERNFLSPEVKESLNAVGISHILALSGLHVAILLSFFLFILFPLSFFGWNKARYVTAILLIWIYVVITGGAPSTVRAAIMATLLVIAFVSERKNSSLNALLAASLIILVIQPLSLWDIGFQLSFLCVASILIFTSKLNPIDRHSHNKSAKVIDVLLISLVTTFCTWIVTAYYFGKVPFMFLPANFILIPLTPIFVGIGMIYTIFIYFGIDIYILAKILDFFEKIYIDTSDFFSLSSQSFLAVTIPAQSVFLWILGIGLVAFTIYNTKKKYKYILSFSAFTLLIVSIFLIYGYKPQEKKSLRFIHDFSAIETRIISENSYKKFKFPKQNISHLKTEEMSIVSIDNVILKDSLTSLDYMKSDKLNFLIIGNKADIKQVAQLINESSFDKVILHAGVGKKKKAELLCLINESSWDNIYSLRDNGSLELEF